MEISDLAIFRAVVEQGGINAAANVLHRVPSNVTARIKKLEAELDKQLFIREKNRLRLSPAGEQLLGYARQILKLADDAIHDLGDGEPSGLLRVGSMEAVAASRLAPVLMTYHQKYGHVKLEVSTRPTGDLIDQVLEGVIDLALVADPPNDPRMDIKPIFHERLVLVSSMMQDEIRESADLAPGSTLLGFGARCAYRQRLTEWMRTSGVVRSIVEINSYHALLNCAAAGMGVGIVPAVLLDAYPFKESIRVHELPDLTAQTTTSLIWRNDSVKPSMLVFRDLLTEEANV